MKKLTHISLLYVLLLVVAMLVNSCKRELVIQNKSQLQVTHAVLKAKAHVESFIQQQGADAFIIKMGFKIIWEKAVTDSVGNIRVPIFLDFGKFKPKDDKQPPLPKTKNVFELYIKNDKGQNEVSIMQFMYLKGKYYPIRLSLDGEVKTKSGFSISMQDIKMLSKKENETQNRSSSLNKTMITESAFMALIQNMYGANVGAVVIYECPSGTWFDPINCFCDYPENVNLVSFYPEIFMALFTGFGIYELVPYPFPFHPSEITSDSEYPDEPIGGGDNPGTYDCDGVLNGSAYMADCGCIGGTTGIESCPGACEVIATMETINATVKPGDRITLTATIQKGSGVTITDKDFEVYYKGTWFESSIESDDPIYNDNTYKLNNAQINVLGELQYRLKIKYTCNDVEATPVYSNVVITNSQYQGSEFIAKFTTEIESAWSQTKASSIANQGTKFEHGFSGYYQRSTREIVIDGGIISASVLCGVSAFGVSLTSWVVPGTINPRFGTNFTVGNFHTHPPLTYCSSSESLAPGPSSIDNDAASNSKFPRIVRTYSTTVSGGQNINLPVTDHFTNSITVTNY